MVRGGNKERYRMRTIIEKGREGYGFFFFLRIESTTRIGIVNRTLCETRARFYRFSFSCDNN